MEVYAIYIYYNSTSLSLRCSKIIPNNFFIVSLFFMPLFCHPFHPVYRYIFGIKNFFFPAPEIENIRASLPEKMFP